MADDMAQEAREGSAGQEPANSTEQDETPDVDALLGEIKKLRNENAKWRTSLRKMEAQQEEKQRAEMTELERLKADLKAAEEARTRAEQERLQTLVRSQVVAAASRLDFADPSDAFRMLDVSTLEVDDSGRVQGLDAALQELAKSKPYLVKRNTPAYSPTNPTGGAPGMSDADILNDIYGPKKSPLFDKQQGGVFWTTKPE